jgi:hypothetical protein
MSGSTSSERMNSLFQEMKLHYLTEPEPGVNSDHDLTLSWPLRNSQVSIVLGSSILLQLNEPGKDTASLNLTGYTDAEIIDVIIQWGLIESKRTLTV